MFSRFTGSKPKAIAASPEQDAKDREALQKAVEEAVSTALGNDAFTKAVAAHLASQIQPSIKTVLDTIKPAVEAVSSRVSDLETKLLSSNEQFSQRLNEASTQTTDKLAELSASNTTTVGKISSLEEVVTKITASLSALGADIKTLQEQVASPDTTLLSSHTTKLDSISADLAAIKADIEAGTAASNNEITGLGTNIGTVLSAIEAQNGTLAEIKSADASSDILAGIKTSNDSHATHASELAALKATDPTPAIKDLDTKLGSIIETLSEIKNTDNHSEILNAVKSSNEFHGSHAASLSELKTATADISALASAAQVKAVTDTLESHTSILGEIKTSTIAPPPISEPVDLSGLETGVKSLATTLDAHTTALEEIKKSDAGADILAGIKANDSTPILKDLETKVGSIIEKLSEIKNPEPIDISALESSVKGLSATLESHTSTLGEIKTASTAPTPVSEPVDLSGLETSVKGLASSLDTQTSSLSEIKKIVSTPAVSENKASEEILSEVKSIKTIVSTPPAVSEDKTSSEILSEVQSVKSLVSEGVYLSSKGVQQIKDTIIVEVKEVGESNEDAEATKAAEGNGVEKESNGVGAEAEAAA
ncbi:hypothetical protein B7494_g5716 [Chlorociboria aeruginascens]|nr:hypothetical protein B7494_g5716 [Chlorociboria aeruginascens]